MELSGHTCFGCGKPVESMGEHIHFDLDEWGAKNGLAPLGLGMELGLTMCAACTVDDPDGWRPEAHEVDTAASKETS